MSGIIIYNIGMLFTLGFIMGGKEHKWYKELLVVMLWPCFLGYIVSGAILAGDKEDGK